MKELSLKSNLVKKKLKAGEVCFGTMLRILKSPQAITLCAAQGWDYLILDTEHNDFDAETLSASALLAKYEETAFFIEFLINCIFRWHRCWIWGLKAWYYLK